MKLATLSWKLKLHPILPRLQHVRRDCTTFCDRDIVDLHASKTAWWLQYVFVSVLNKFGMMVNHGEPPTITSRCLPEDGPYMVSVLYCELQAHQGDQVPGEATHFGVYGGSKHVKICQTKCRWEFFHSDSWYLSVSLCFSDVDGCWLFVVVAEGFLHIVYFAGGFTICWWV